jgi:D-sedoheptulose 7-phosphate isomerase
MKKKEEIIDRMIMLTDVIFETASQTKEIIEAIELIKSIISNNGKILLCGNGGSAADCQHIATEFVVRFKETRPGIKAIALTTDTSILTATGNDFSFNDIFSRQVSTLGDEGDVLIAISTSGTSPNILKAIEAALIKNMKVIFLTGANIEKTNVNKDLKNVHYIIVPSEDTPRIQECHIMIGHIICEFVEKWFKESHKR